MKYIIIILSLFVSKNSVAQHLDKEVFVDQVYTTSVDSSFPYYLLYNEARQVNKNALNIPADLIADSILKQLLNNYSLDTLEQFWDLNKLLKAKGIDKDSIGLVTGSATRTYALSSWSKKRKIKEERKQLEAQYKQREKMPPYQTRVYYFSRPLFDDKKNYAVLTMSYGCGMLCGYGCTYIFKFIDNQWKVIWKTQCWIS